MYDLISNSVITMCKKKIGDLRFKAEFGIEDFDNNCEKIDLLQSVINNIKLSENEFSVLTINEDVIRYIIELFDEGYSKKDILMMYFNNHERLNDLRFITANYHEEWIIYFLGGMYKFSDEDDLLILM